MKSSLTSAQQKTLMYIVVTVVLLAMAGGMIYDVNRRRAEADSLNKDMVRKEQDASAVALPTDEDQAEWASREKQLADLLLPDQAVPELLEEITRLANENRLQRLGISNEDKSLEGTQTVPSPEDAKLLAVGIKRYLVITLKFQSEYPDAARFLGAVAALRRPVEFGVVDMRRNPPQLDVTLTLKVYKREPTV
jgi:Tfp pilus assembly protein PilO